MKFSCVSSSECSSTRFFQNPGTLTFIMFSKVENVLSNTTWYWGKKCPVLVFHNRYTDPAWNGDFPMYTPVLSLGPHLGSPAGPPWSRASSKNTGQTQVWYYVGKIWNSIPENFCSGVFPLLYIYSMLYLWHDALNEKDHIMVITASGHNMVAWMRRFQLTRVNSLILRLTIEFLWWDTTPQ